MSNQFALSPIESYYRMTRPMPAGQVMEAPRPGTFAPGKRIMLIRGEGVPPALADAFQASVFHPSTRVDQLPCDDERIGAYQHEEAFVAAQPDIYYMAGVDACLPGQEDEQYAGFLPAPNFIGDYDCTITLHYVASAKCLIALFAGYTGDPPHGIVWDDDALD